MKVMGGRIFGREPILYLALVKAGIALAVGFGFDLTSEQMALIVVFTEALLALIARWVIAPVRAPAATSAREHREGQYEIWTDVKGK